MESLCGCKIPDGHPLFVLYKENDAISKQIARTRNAVIFEEPDEVVDAALSELRAVRSHYAKKRDCLYPALRERDGAALTAELAAEDERILRELDFLAADEELFYEAWSERLLSLLDDMRRLLVRENNVFFPLLSQGLTEQEWIQIYFDFRAHAPCLIDGYAVWPRAEDPDAPRCACEG